MKLLKLQLENFRSASRGTFEFDPTRPLTVIAGPNGLGKTNLLEAVYVLSLGRSFRAVLQDDLISWGMDYFRLIGEIETKEKTEIEVSYSNYPSRKKIFKKNGAALKNSEYIGTFLTVLFHPEDLNILYLSPSLRRRYMDILLSQADRRYLVALTKYNQILKQRNALLDEIRRARFARAPTSTLLDDLFAWDKEIVEFGSAIIEKRLQLLSFLNQKLPKLYRAISGGKETLTVSYLSKIEPPDSPAKLPGLYTQTLSNRMEKDILQAKTTAGPHRDDLAFYLNEKEINVSASRGEFRTLLLAIKLAEIEFIRELTGEDPILLLDDVFSELDRSRQNRLLKAIKGCQAIITTTDMETLGKLASESQHINLAEVK